MQLLLGVATRLDVSLFLKSPLTFHSQRQQHYRISKNICQPNLVSQSPPISFSCQNVICPAISEFEIF